MGEKTPPDRGENSGLLIGGFTYEWLETRIRRIA